MSGISCGRKASCRRPEFYNKRENQHGVGCMSHFPWPTDHMRQGPSNRCRTAPCPFFIQTHRRGPVSVQPRRYQSQNGLCRTSVSVLRCCPSFISIRGVRGRGSRPPRVYPGEGFGSGQIVAGDHRDGRAPLRSRKACARRLPDSGGPPYSEAGVVIRSRVQSYSPFGSGPARV